MTAHYSSLAQRALPAIVFGVIVTSGAIKEKRIARLDQVVRCPAEMSETAFKTHLLERAKENLLPDEIAVVDAGLGLPDLHNAGLKRYVARMAVNCTVRKNVLPPYKGRGAPPKFGALIRPLARRRLDKTIAASEPEGCGTFEVQGRLIRYHAWHSLVTTTTHVAQDNPQFSLFVFFDPLYKKPMVLATDMTNFNAQSVYLIYKDRWPVEHPPLAAKQIIGLHRQFVFNDETCFRLPELALLAGNVLTHCAAILPPAPTGFWDRTPKPTPGRLRRQLSQALFPNLAPFDAQLRKKNSVFQHLPRGIHAHRRQSASRCYCFTGN